MKKLGIVLATLLVLVIIIGTVGCGGKQPEPTAKPTFKIGEKLVSGSFQVKVVGVEERVRIEETTLKSHTTLDARGNDTFLLVAVELENMSNSSSSITLSSDGTSVQDASGQHYPLMLVGTGSFWFWPEWPSISHLGVQVFDSEGTTNSVDIVVDSLYDTWTIDIEASASLSISLVYQVPIEASGFHLSLLDFTSISLEE